MYILTAVVLIAVVCTAQARIGTGSCARVPKQENFQLSRFMGQWYGQVEFAAGFNFGVSCSRTKYTLKPDGNLQILNKGYYRLIGKTVTVNGAGYINAGNPGVIEVEFFRLLPSADYNVVETDYDSYSVIYSCSDIGFLKSETAWVLSRSTGGISQSALENVYTRLRSYGIDTSNFNTITQDRCPLSLK